MKNDIYEQLNQLTKELKKSGKSQLAEIIDHRINKVAWTTSSELFDEIKKLLNKEITVNEAELSETLKGQINDLLRIVSSEEE